MPENQTTAVADSLDTMFGGQVQAAGNATANATAISNMLSSETLSSSSALLTLSPKASKELVGLRQQQIAEQIKNSEQQMAGYDNLASAINTYDEFADRPNIVNNIMGIFKPEYNGQQVLSNIQAAGQQVDALQSRAKATDNMYALKAQQATFSGDRVIAEQKLTNLKELAPLGSAIASIASSAASSVGSIGREIRSQQLQPYRMANEQQKLVNQQQSSVLAGQRYKINEQMLAQQQAATGKVLGKEEADAVTYQTTAAKVGGEMVAVQAMDNGQWANTAEYQQAVQLREYAKTSINPKAQQEIMIKANEAIEALKKKITADQPEPVASITKLRLDNSGLLPPTAVNQAFSGWLAMKNDVGVMTLESSLNDNYIKPKFDAMLEQRLTELASTGNPDLSKLFDGRKVSSAEVMQSLTNGKLKMKDLEPLLDTKSLLQKAIREPDNTTGLSPQARYTNSMTDQYIVKFTKLYAQQIQSSGANNPMVVEKAAKIDRLANNAKSTPELLASLGTLLSDYGEESQFNDFYSSLKNPEMINNYISHYNRTVVSGYDNRSAVLPTMLNANQLPTGIYKNLSGAKATETIKTIVSSMDERKKQRDLLTSAQLNAEAQKNHRAMQ